jgi:lipoate-protein ligase A
MYFLSLTLPTTEENLALDEALLDAAEAGELPGETLRIWESPRPIVVLGRSSRAAEEVHLDVCRARNVPVFRRSSGGTAIVAGPGCLMYALVLGYKSRHELRAIDAAHRFVLGTIAAVLAPFVPAIRHRGTSDLAIHDRKCSGNSMRCKREHFLYHGTLLYGFRLALISECLAMPPRQPDYRQRRPHAAFVANMPVTAAALCQALKTAFDATEPVAHWPEARTRKLAREKYATLDWTFRH